MRLFRKLLVLVVLAAASAIAIRGPSAAAAPHPSASPELSQTALLVAMNAERTKRHLAPLRLSAPLNAAARQHSLEMARRGYFAHESADGSSFSKRIRRFYGRTGYRLFSAGENILWSTLPLTAAGAIVAWMHSPGHRRNILNRRWREIGISAVEAAAAPGVYRGLDVAVLTTDFGIRRR
jgi:uncharacterized protein YkwD